MYNTNNFPFLFEKCPNCGKGIGVVQVIAEKDLDGQQLPENFRPGMVSEVPLISGSRPPLLFGANRIKVLRYVKDICEWCGTIWAKVITVEEVIAQVDNDIMKHIGSDKWPENLRR